MNRMAHVARACSNIAQHCKARFFSRHSICGNQVICPLARATAQSRQYSTQWFSNPKVFPGFDLGLLGQTQEAPNSSYEPKAIDTYPVGEEEVFNGKYQTIQKIGYGPTATVFLAADLTQGRLVVLKIYVVMHVLKAYGRPHPQKVYPRDEYPLREVIDRFVIEGPKGKHICIVHAPPPIDLAEWISGDKLRLEAMKSSIRQLLIILDYLHTDCFTTARVDPIRYHEANHEANPDLEAEKASELTTTLLPGDGVPLFIDYPDDDAKAGLVAKHIRAPEEILKSPWDYKVDIWSVAICAWDIVSSRNLINGRNAEGAFDDRVHVAELVALLGPPPPEFRDKMSLGSMFWDEEGQWTGQTPIPDRSLEKLAEEVKGEDLDGFLQWMRKAMQWDPADRPTALGLMRHEWMAHKSETKEEERGEPAENTSG